MAVPSRAPPSGPASACSGPAGNGPDKIECAIPAALPDSSSEWFTWQLAANATLEGADFEAEFEMPVFKR